MSESIGSDSSTSYYLTLSFGLLTQWISILTHTVHSGPDIMILKVFSIDVFIIFDYGQDLAGVW